MLIKNDAARFGVVAQLFHWVTVALVVALFAVAFYMVDLPLSPEKIKTYNLHKSLGLTVLCLAVLRLAWRLVTPPPPLPHDMASWERRAARTSHALLYLMLFAQPLLGLVHSWAANFPVVIYGTITLPNPIGANEPLKNAVVAAHFWLGMAMLGLIALHTLAALKHHVVDRDDILRRMLPGAGPSKEAQTKT